MLNDFNVLNYTPIMRVISIDYLQLYCHAYFLKSNSMFHFELQHSSSRQFKRIYKVYDLVTNDHYATVQAEPFSPVIPKHAVIVKIANRELYKQRWAEQVNYFLNVCFIVPQSVSRLDLCCDFNQFDNNLQVNTFFDRFLSNKYLKNRLAKYTLQGEQTDRHQASYIRFGNHDSEVSVYLYNKSLEMREVKTKPYITERWAENQLDVNKDVWRLEVSLKSTRLKFVVAKTGELFRIDLEHTATQGMLENIYNAVIQKYWDFRVNDGKSRKDRMRKVTFFKSMPTTLIPYSITEVAGSNRTDKIVVKKLANVVTELRLDMDQPSPALEAALWDYIEHKDLKEYYYEKIKPYVKIFKD